MAAFAVDKLLQRVLDRGPLIGYQPLDEAHGRSGHRALEPRLERGNALVLVDTLRSAVADRHQADHQFVVRCGHWGASIARRKQENAAAGCAEPVAGAAAASRRSRAGSSLTG